MVSKQVGLEEAGAMALELLSLDLKIVNRPVLAVRTTLLSDPDNLCVNKWESNHRHWPVSPSSGDDFAPFIIRHYYNFVFLRVIVCRGRRIQNDLAYLREIQKLYLKPLSTLLSPARGPATAPITINCILTAIGVITCGEGPIPTVHQRWRIRLFQFR